MNQKMGKASVKPDNPVYILNSASVVGTKEGDGPLGLLFDKVGEDDMLQEIYWASQSPHLLAYRPFRFLSLACTAPVPPVASRCFWEPWRLRVDLRTGC